METLEKMTRMAVRIAKSRDYAQGFADALNLTLNIICEEGFFESEVGKELTGVENFEKPEK